MATVADAVVALVALLHVYVQVLEMFFRTTPRGQKAFGIMPEFAQQTRVLAANQGPCNGFLAAGLFWGLYLGPPGQAVKIFFLSCVGVAGLFGVAGRTAAHGVGL
jgi:putative membrane protein